MVFINYFKTDHNQFLISVPKDTLIENLVQILVQINNLRIEIDLFACALQDLATHGPLKPEEIRGLDTQQLMDNALVMSSQDRKAWGIKRKPIEDQRYNQDPTKYRIGIIKNQHLTKMMIETSNKAKKMISYKNVAEKKLLSIEQLKNMIEEMIAAVRIAYPNFEGLGEWETAVMFAENRYDLAEKNTNLIDYLTPKQTTAWFAGKQLLRGKQLRFYTKQNEKTTIVVKLTKQGSGAPMRQPAVTEQQQKQMMAHFYKKQQQLKKLQNNEQDDYLNSPWANPNNLKSHLVNGGSGIQWRVGK